MCQFSLATCVSLASLVTVLTGQDSLALDPIKARRVRIAEDDDAFSIYLKISIRKTTLQLSHSSGIRLCYAG